MNQDIIDLYDEYTHAPLPRRVFLDRLVRLAGGSAAAMALLPMLEANYARADMVAADDSRIAGEVVSFDGPDGPLAGYLARPAGVGTTPAVLVVHENRGLNPHIRDIARRLAVAGYTALALDYLTPAGGTPADEDKAREMIGTRDAGKVDANSLAALEWLAGHDATTGKVGMVGFCWGGGAVGRAATKAGERLDAAVVFYGAPPPAEDVAAIRAPLLLHYAGLDQRINAMVFPAFTDALEKADVPHTVHVYDGVNHAFNNDTAASRYDEAAATLAWERTVAFFDETLKG